MPGESETPTPETDDYSGAWMWQLNQGEPIDPSGYGACSFQDSLLSIQVSGTNITLQEMLNGIAMVTYMGTLTNTSFSVTDTSSGLQSIAGNFDSTTTFSGTYAINTAGLIPECETPRGVHGVKQ